MKPWRCVLIENNMIAMSSVSAFKVFPMWTLECVTEALSALKALEACLELAIDEIRAEAREDAEKRVKQAEAVAREEAEAREEAAEQLGNSQRQGGSLSSKLPQYQ